MRGGCIRRLEFREILEHSISYQGSLISFSGLLFNQKLLNYTTSDASSTANHVFREDQPAFVCNLKRGLLSPEQRLFQIRFHKTRGGHGCLFQ